MSYDPTFQLYPPQVSTASTLLETHDELLTELMLGDSFMRGFEYDDGRPTMGSTCESLQNPSAMGSQASDLLIPDNWDDAVYALPQGDSFVPNIEQGQEEMWFPNTNPSSQFQHPSVDPQTFIHPENFGNFLNTSTQESSPNSIVEFTEGRLTVGFGDGLPPHNYASSARPVGRHLAHEHQPYPAIHQHLAMLPNFNDSQGQSHPGYTSSRAYDADDVNHVAPARGASYLCPPVGDSTNLYSGQMPMPIPIPRLPIHSPREFYPRASYTPSVPAPHYSPPFQAPCIPPQPPAHAAGRFSSEGDPIASSSQSRGRSKRKLIEVESDEVEERKPKTARKGRENDETYLSTRQTIMDGKAVASLGLRAIKPRVEGEAAADALRRNNYKSRETTYENDNLVDVSFPNNSKMSHGGPSAIPPVDLKANQEAFRATKKGRRKSDQEKPHRCTQCGHGFERSNDLKRHLITAVVHHPRSFQCAQCGKFLSRKDALSTHQRTQHGL